MLYMVDDGTRCELKISRHFCFTYMRSLPPWKAVSPTVVLQAVISQIAIFADCGKSARLLSQADVI